MSRQPSRRCPRASGIGHRSRPQAGSGGSWPRCIVKTWRSCLRNSAKSPPPLRTCRRAFSATADSGKEKRYAMTCPWRHKHNPFHRKVRGNTFGILTWVFIARALANSLGVEHDDIGRFAGLQHPAVTQVQDLCGETCHLADRLFECEQTQIAAVMSQNTRATAISPRMGPAAEQTVGAHGT